MTGLGAESEEKMVFSKESGLRRFCVGCVAAVVLFAGCSGPRPSGLRGPAPKKGQEFRTESTFRIDDGKIVVRAGDTTIEGVFSLSTAEVEEGRILSVREREIEKEEVTIVLDDTDVAFLFDGERKTEKERGALVGKRILKRRVDGKTMSTLVGESATPEQEAALNSLDALDSDAYLYPDTSVPPGHRWRVDAVHLKRYFGLESQEVAGDVSMTYAGTESRNGEPCAVIAVALKASWRETDENRQVRKVELDGNGRTYRSMKTGWDIESTLSGAMTITATEVEEGESVQTVMSGPVTLESRSTIRQ
jgi:hypothetical protein